VFKIDDITITCLHPTKGFIPKSKNAYSTVLSLTYKDFDLLLTGDLEKDGEEIVNAELKKSFIGTNGYEVLKVAHHGSKYSSKSEFLTLVNPKYAVISCGKNNNYGHPHEELLRRMEEKTKNIMITYKTGTVTIATDGKKMRVWEYLRKQ
jgi:competence protein ComEC